MDENTIMHVVMAGWIGAGLVAAVWLLLAPRYRADRRRALRTGGLSTVIVGTVTVLGAPFVPFGVYTSQTSGIGLTSETTTRLESMWAIGIEPSQMLWLAVVWVAAVTVATSALIHRSAYTQVVRWMAALVLIVLTWLSIFTIGWMFVPVTLLALVTAIHGAQTEGARPGDEEGRPEHDRTPFPETG